MSAFLSSLPRDLGASCLFCSSLSFSLPFLTFPSPRPPPSFPLSSLWEPATPQGEPAP